MSVICFVCYVGLVAMAVKFMLTLAEKWNILSWLQAHAPNEFFHKLFTCNFCQSWWLGVFLSVLLAVFIDWRLIFIPIFSSSLR
jgi:hypothetical protein